MALGDAAPGGGGQARGASGLRVLLVEDKPGDRRLIVESLAARGRVGDVRFDLTESATLAGAIECFPAGNFDAVLLDLGLPDSQGLDSLRRLRAAGDAPVIVLTGGIDDEQGLQAVREGAADYLTKDQATAPVLERAVRYAVERRRLLEMVEEERLRKRGAEELDRLEHLAEENAIPVTSRSLGSVDLRLSAPDIFEQLVERYGGVIAGFLEEGALKVVDRTSDELFVIARTLGALRAGPRDAVDLHRTAATNWLRRLPVRRISDFEAEGRMLLIKLMGFLVSYYRAQSMTAPSSRRNGPNRGNGGTPR